MAILPTIYKTICGYFISKTPLGFDQLFFASTSIFDLLVASLFFSHNK
jgi:hypothetical protein